MESKFHVALHNPYAALQFNSSAPVIWTLQTFRYRAFLCTCTSKFSRRATKNLKQSLFRPGKAVRAVGGWESQNLWTIGTWWRQGCQPYTPVTLPLPTRRYSWYSFLLEAEPIPGPQCGWKD